LIFRWFHSGKKKSFDKLKTGKKFPDQFSREFYGASVTLQPRVFLLYNENGLGSHTDMFFSLSLSLSLSLSPPGMDHNVWELEEGEEAAPHGSGGVAHGTRDCDPSRRISQVERVAEGY
jgi:hypothetical protein